MNVEQRTSIKSFAKFGTAPSSSRGTRSDQGWFRGASHVTRMYECSNSTGGTGRRKGVHVEVNGEEGADRLLIQQWHCLPRARAGWCHCQLALLQGSNGTYHLPSQTHQLESLGGQKLDAGL